jgi:hypothetical protein
LEDIIPDPDDKALLKAAVEQVGILRKQAIELKNQARTNLRWRRTVVVVCVALVVAVGVLSYVVIHQHSDDVALRNSSIVQCQNGNSFREGQTQIWQEFITLITPKGTSAKVLGIANGFMKHTVEKVDATHDCQAIFNSPSNAGGNP